MRPLFPPLTRSNGFILLHALWLLITAAALISGIMTTTLYSSEEFTIAEQKLLAKLVQESAIQLVIYDILTNGNRSNWLRQGASPRNIEIEGQNVIVSVQNVSGLVDAITADRIIWEQLLSRLQINQSHPRYEKPASGVTQKIGMTGYTELRAHLRLTDTAFNCLYPHITISSGKHRPETRYATATLIKLLNLPVAREGSTLAEDDNLSAAGSTYRINVFTSKGLILNDGLSVEVSITGQILPSHLIRSWQRITRDTPDDPCNKN